MALEPSKHVNGRMWPPGVSGNPNGRPVGSRTAFSHGFLKDLAEVWQEHGRDTMLHTAKTQPATFFEAPNECAIYLLPSGRQGNKKRPLSTSPTKSGAPCSGVP